MKKINNLQLLIKQNKEEILSNKSEIERIEKRIDRKHMAEISVLEK